MNALRPFLKPLLSLILLLPAATPAFAAEGKPQGLPVETVVVGAETVSNTLSAVGTLLADEAVVITTEIAGRVEAVEFSEGESVRRGAILLRLDPSVLQAERDRAAAQLELSAANYRRAEALLADKATSQQARDEAFAAWKLADAQFRLADAQLAKTVLRAPFDGRLGLRLVSPGSYLPPGTEVVTLDALDPLKVEFQVPETRRTALQPGQEVTVSVGAVPDRTFSGTVYAITPRVDTGGRSISLRARIANPDGVLLPGMFARVVLQLGERPEAVFVPEEALIASGDKLLVYKVVEGKVEATPVTTGLRRKGEVEVLEGLVPGDEVITAGHIKVRPGMPVTTLPARQAAQGE